VPCIISAQNLHRFHGPWPVAWLKRRVYSRCMRRHTDLVVCTSQPVRRELVERFGVPAGVTRVLPNAIDVRNFPRHTTQQRQRVRRDLGIGDEQLLFVNVGRPARQKGQDLLLRAFAATAAERPEVKLALVGPAARAGRSVSPFERKLRQFAERRLDGRVLLLGWRDDVPLLLAAADAYVHAARWEGWPLAVLEAMAAGVPVIMTDCSGRPEGFRNGVHGEFVPSEDVEALADAMVRVASMSVPSRSAAGGAARELAEKHYDIRDVSRRFVDMVEEVL
jgi:glycosyltransferase involved in cell wall biosynthesis